MSISIKHNGSYLPLTSFMFSGGEEHVRIGVDDATQEHEFVINARLTTSASVMQLLMVTDALRRAIPNPRMILNMPYIPYARQDRVCNLGEALSIRVFCDLINGLEFDEVHVLMPHSDVALALLNNASEAFHNDRWDSFIMQKMSASGYKDVVIVSPDAGAMKRTLKFAQKYNHSPALEAIPVVMADKVRDVTNGQILRTTVHAAPDEIKGKSCLIYDDICDGGMTFIKLAEALREQGAKHVILAVPHGIFSKGLDPIANQIDHVITTGVFIENIPREHPMPIDILSVAR